MMRDGGAVLTGLGFGFGLIYFLNPGVRRRGAVASDTPEQPASAGADESSAAPRLLAYRASGVAARLRSTFRRPVEDDVLIDRLRAQISGAVLHPHLIDVEASDHHVILRGPILERDVDSLLDAVERASGVREIVNDLDVRQTADFMPARQERRPPEPEFFNRPWSPATRLLVGAAGTVLAGYGASRRDASGVVLAAAGAGLLARATGRRASPS